MKVIKIGNKWGILRDKIFDKRQAARNYLKAEFVESIRCMRQVDALLERAEASLAESKAQRSMWEAEKDLDPWPEKENTKRHLH